MGSGINIPDPQHWFCFLLLSGSQFSQNRALKSRLILAVYISATRPCTKNGKTEKCLLYLSNSKYVTLDLKFEFRIGVLLRSLCPTLPLGRGGKGRRKVSLRVLLSLPSPCKGGGGAGSMCICGISLQVRGPKLPPLALFLHCYYLFHLMGFFSNLFTAFFR